MDFLACYALFGLIVILIYLVIFIYVMFFMD